MTRPLDAAPLAGPPLDAAPLDAAPLAGPPVERASPAQKSAASAAFSAGDQAFDIQDYQTALESFRDSLAQVNSPNSRLMLARCLLELGRLDEAYSEYAEVVRDAQDDPRYKDALKTGSEERQALKSRLAWVDLDIGDMPKDVVILVDDREIGTGKPVGLVPINPGGAVIAARAPDGTQAIAQVHLAAGREVRVTLVRNETQVFGTPEESAPTQAGPAGPSEPLASPAPPPQAHPLRPWVVVAGGVAVAGAAGVATFGILAQNRYNSLSEDCVDGQCPPSSQKDIDRGSTYQLLTNVSLGVGIAGLTTAAVLLLLDHKPRKESNVAVQLGIQSITVSGVF